LIQTVATRFGIHRNANDAIHMRGFGSVQHVGQHGDQRVIVEMAMSIGPGWVIRHVKNPSWNYWTLKKKRVK
jgi:hypothetical protein